MLALQLQGHKCALEARFAFLNLHSILQRLVKRERSDSRLQKIKSSNEISAVVENKRREECNIIRDGCLVGRV